MKMTHRPVIVIDVNDSSFDKVSIAKPEFIVLVYQGRTMDIGALCYKQRGKTAAYKPNGRVYGAPVCVASLIPERRQSIKLLTEYLIDTVRLGGSCATTEKHYKAMRIFYAFCDGLVDGQHDFTNKATISLYTQHLIGLIHSGNLSQLTAQERQSLVCRLHAAYHHISADLVYSSDAPLIRAKGKLILHTQPLDDIRLAKATSLSRAIFEGACLASVAPQLPVFFNTPEGKAVFSPQIPSLYFQKNRDKFSASAFLCLDFDNECIRTAADIPKDDFHVLPAHLRKYPGRYLHRFKHARLNSAQNNRSVAHLEAVNLGVSCFFGLFIAATGLNLSTALSLKWSDKYEFKENGPSLREVIIKPRAGYQEVAFTITAVFQPLLLKYIKLREYILNGRPSSDLFVVFAGKPRPCTDVPERFIESRYSALRDTLSRRACIDYLPTAREFRATRSDFNIRKHGVVKAAELNGNSVETTLKSYASGSKSRAASALTPFYQKIRESAYQTIRNTEAAHVPLSSGAAGDIPIKTGHCASFMKPALASEFNENAPVPSCEKSAHGCLFCENYRFHMSETDIRKLFSLLECIYLIKKSASSLEHFEISWGAVIRRTEDIIDEAAKQHPDAKDMLDTVFAEVTEDGELDPYWLAHYNMVRELTS